MVGVKPDEAGEVDEGAGEQTFSREEVASAGLSSRGNGGGAATLSPERRRSVVAGLVHPTEGK